MRFCGYVGRKLPDGTCRRSRDNNKCHGSSPVERVHSEILSENTQVALTRFMSLRRFFAINAAVLSEPLNLRGRWRQRRAALVVRASGWVTIKLDVDAALAEEDGLHYRG